MIQQSARKLLSFHVAALAAVQNLEGCPASGGDYVWLDTWQADGKTVYASVLAAYLAGRKVDIGVHGCSSEGRPRVYGVTVLQ